MSKQKNRIVTTDQAQVLARQTRHIWLLNRRGQATPAHREYIGDAC
jgi:hypothetical protein